MIKIVFFPIILIIIALVGCQSSSPENPEQLDVPKNVAPKEVIIQEFDIPSIVGKNPEQITEVLGDPTSKFEPTSDQRDLLELDMAVTYTKEEFELQMDFFDNEVTTMTICAANGIHYYATTLCIHSSLTQGEKFEN